MLRLKQVELLGFKSFRSRERLHFSGTGVAAVVGPNGCGKSNLCDAVNWVLGEQSAKSLRGGRMKDVIFGGTRRRKPAGMAKVTLTLHDPDSAFERLFGNRRDLPAGRVSGEIEVTRKLFANGASHYILNGKRVRLRDVRELFLGTGLGPNHYAIIEQGRIGQLLVARSLERRAFIEEAAGVTRYEARRRQSDLKLANSQLNLERVHDILREVGRQAGALKRQARRARRHGRYVRELRDVQRQWFAGKHGLLHTRREGLESSAASAREHVAAAEAEVARLEGELECQRERHAEWAAKLDSDREELARTRIRLERRRERVRQQLAAIAENEKASAQAARELESLAARIGKGERRVEEQSAEVSRHEAKASGFEGELRACAAECRERQALIDKAAATAERSRREMVAAMEALSDTKGDLGRFEAILAGHASSMERQRTAERKADKALREVREKLRARRGESAGLAESVRSKGTEIEALGRSVRDAGARVTELRAERDARAARVSRLAARRDSTREILRHRAYGAETVKDIFEAAAESSPDRRFRPLGVLADYLDVDPGFAAAVEQFLGEDLEQVVVEGWDEAARGVRMVIDQLTGRAAFVLADTGQISREPPRPAVPSGVVPLMDHVRVIAPEGGKVPAPVPQLSRGYLAPSSVDARELAERHPQLYFLLADGTWYHGRTVHGGRGTASGPLVLKQRLADLASQLRAARKSRSESEDAITAAGEQSTEKIAALEKARSELNGLKGRSLTVRHKIRQSEGLVARHRNARASARATIERLRREREGAESGQRRSMEAQEQLEAECSRLEQRRASLAARADDARGQLAAAQEKHSGVRIEATAVTERLRAERDAQRAAQSRLAAQRRRMSDLTSRVQDLADRNANLAKSSGEIEARIAAGTELRRDLGAGIAATVTRLGESRKRTAELHRFARDGRAAEAARREECSKIEVALARVQSDLEHLASDCTAELGDPLGTVSASADSIPDPEELGQLEDRRQSLRGRIGRLGPVNVLAAKEFEEVSGRKEFLEAQRADLVESIANTREAIRKLTEASRERFQVAFNGINRHFGATFATLFGGGTGELRLTDPDDPDSSGVDIVAQPPGKRLQSVALLSGGEKSLTVMALLMATFRHQPSPFCVLDEVDSHLDEANTVRLRGLIQEMAPETQFVVITHSKAMMGAAEALYGVTMAEAGVSQLVSVRMAGRMAQAQPLATAIGEVA